MKEPSTKVEGNSIRVTKTPSKQDTITEILAKLVISNIFASSCLDAEKLAHYLTLVSSPVALPKVSPAYEKRYLFSVPISFFLKSEC